MIFYEGINYYFLNANEDSTLRVESDPLPFYSFPLKKIERLPSLYSEPSLIPRFNYNVRWNRRNFSSKEITEPTPPSHKSWNFIQGGRFHKQLHLQRQPRNQMVSARYLSLRDIVNPEYSEEDILREIEKLYFKPKEKSTFFRLVKILYAGKTSEEREIVSNLFSHEKDFALFLRDQIFKIEILPLIHGIFLQDILSKMDERIIKHGLSILSPPVIEVIKRSVSKNKFSSILDSPSLEPKEGESLTEIIESLLFRRFSRKIYYEEGSYTAYRIPTSEDPERKTIQSLIDSNKFQFATSQEGMDFLGASQTKLFFLIKDWVSVVRFDIVLNPREWESYEYYRLPPQIILEIPFYPQARSLSGGIIFRNKELVEFYFSNWGFF
jgi:hypothetical protein